MVFGDALERAKAGQYITRSGWPWPDRVYTSYTDDMQPYLMVDNGEREPIPYTVTDVDLFATDWEVIQCGKQ